MVEKYGYQIRGGRGGKLGGPDYTAGGGGVRVQTLKYRRNYQFCAKSFN